MNPYSLPCPIPSHAHESSVCDAMDNNSDGRQLRLQFSGKKGIHMPYMC